MHQIPTAPASGTKFGGMIGRRLAFTHRTVRRFTEHRLHAVGSTLSAVIIGRILSDETGLSQRQLAERMGIEGPSLVRHIDRMEMAGHVERVRDTVDRRIQRVRLTPKGRTAHRRLETIAAAANRDLTNVFTKDELALFEEFLDRIGDNAHALLTSEVPR